MKLLTAPNLNLIYPAARIVCLACIITVVVKKSVVWYVSLGVDGYRTPGYSLPIYSALR
jgi:hypothetical protein